MINLQCEKNLVFIIITSCYIIIYNIEKEDITKRK